MSFENFVRKIMQNGKYLGGGFAKNVFTHPDKQNRAVGVFHEERGPQPPGAANMLFFRTKIAHLLFPKNISNIHRATTEPETVEKDYVIGTKLTDADTETPEFEELLEKFYEAGIGVDAVDPGNFLKDQQGNIVYIDDVGYTEIEKLKQAIETRLSGGDRGVALEWLERLRSLHATHYKKTE